jgi:CubicO group peptidase (beta-lactamase class C family)
MSSPRTRVAPVLLIVLYLFLPSVSRTQQSVVDAIDRYCEKSRQEWNLPGMAVAVVRNDSVIVMHGYGVRTIGKPDPVDDRTLFAIASLSKAFTAASLGILVDRGRLTFDTKVSELLPQFQLFDPFATREMMVRDLLAHRSGLPTFGGDLIWYGTGYSRAEVLRRIRYLKPRFSFRAGYGYQNVMVLAAGEIIPVLTGRSWDDFVRDSIFVPLGMTESTTSVKALQGSADVASPHITHDGAVITVPYRDVDNVGPAAAVNSSARDLSRWMMMWLRDDSTKGPVLLSARTKNQIWTAHTPLGISPAAQRMMPSRHFSAAGLGWFMYDYRGRKILNHGGAMDGMISQITLVPEEHLGVIVLTNATESPASPVSNWIIDQFLGGGDRDWSGEALKRRRDGEARALENQKHLEETRARGTKPSLALASYAGTYRSTMYGDVSVRAEGAALVVRFMPTASYVANLTHWHYDTFRITMRDPTLPQGFVTFVLDSAGQPAEMKVDIPNPDFDFGELELKRTGEVQ